jgi:hypothetical protein
VNVIVRPDVYERHRTAVRGEPLLWVRGKLAKDDGTVNVLAEEARGLQLSVESTDDSSAPHSTLRTPHSPYGFLKTFRRIAPASKDWG